MSIRLTASSSQALERTTNLPDYNSTYEWEAWFYFHSLPGTDNYGTLVNIGRTSDSGVDQFGYGNGGSGTATFTLWIHDGSNGNGVFSTITITQNTWYHVRGRRTSSSNAELWVNGVLEITNTSNVSGRGAAQTMDIGRGHAGGFVGEYGDLTIAGLNIWSANLSDNEAAAERRFIFPIRRADLNSAYPFFDGERTKDYSNNGYTLTEIGSPTTGVVTPPATISNGTVWLFVPPTAGATDKSASDAAAVTEVSSIGAGASSSDSASLVEAVAIGLTGVGDTASLAEAASLATSSATNDTAALAESAAVNASLPGSDSGSLGESGSVGASASTSDSGTLTESASVVAQISANDSASLAEATSVFAGENISSNDSTTLNESSSIAASAASADSAVLAEAAQIAAALPGADTGSLGEGGTVNADTSTSDTASLADASTLFAQLAGVDGGGLSEATSIIVEITSSDGFSLNETIAVLALIAAIDTASLTEGASVEVAGQVILAGARATTRRKHFATVTRREN